MGEPSLSIIIPVRNGSATIGRCLEAACAFRDEGTEIIVVDDCSTDGSAGIISSYPCTLVRHDRRAGAGAARNTGARRAQGEYLFFIDADCLLLERTVASIRTAIRRHAGAVIGGTYTVLPADADFFSAFQSVFIHYHETRRAEPDYIASHSLVIRTDVFRAAGGFPDPFLPMIEDVEFSHRLRRAGNRLVMVPDIQVRHIFSFSFRRSLVNAYTKTRHWTVYLMRSGEALTDSGTASSGLKVNVAAFLTGVLILLAAAVTGTWSLAAAASVPLAAAVGANQGLLSAFQKVRRRGFALCAALYYFLVYPAAVAAGTFAGLAQHLTGSRLPGLERARP